MHEGARNEGTSLSVDTCQTRATNVQMRRATFLKRLEAARRKVIDVAQYARNAADRNSHNQFRQPPTRAETEIRPRHSIFNTHLCHARPLSHSSIAPSPSAAPNSGQTEHAQRAPHASMCHAKRTTEPNMPCMYMRVVCLARAGRWSRLGSRERGRVRGALVTALTKRNGRAGALGPSSSLPPLSPQEDLRTKPTGTSVTQYNHR